MTDRTKFLVSLSVRVIAAKLDDLEIAATNNQSNAGLILLDCFATRRSSISSRRKVARRSTLRLLMSGRESLCNVSKESDMLLVCGGLSRAVKPVKITEDVTSFPIVVALVSDGDEHKLPAIMANINEPFVVRLLDKDLIKIVESDAWKNAMRRERGE